MTEQTTETGAWLPAEEPRVAEFGPCRAIGMRYVGKNEQGEIPALWHQGFMPRMGEIAPLEGGAFGVCRCLPGATDGSFEYIAALRAGEGGPPAPEGMVEVSIPRAQYVIFHVRHLGEIHQAWEYLRNWFPEHPEWEAYCGPSGCGCAEYPTFEYYPPDFGEGKPLYLYAPVRAR